MDSTTAQNGDSEFPWRYGVFDAHCHPTDTMASIDEISSMNAATFTIMATRAQDQELVDQVASQKSLAWNEEDENDSTPSRKRIIPSFGWHPWFSHQLYDDRTCPWKGGQHLSANERSAHYKAALSPSPQDDAFLADLPDPKSLSAFLDETRERLSRHPRALVGEIGLDKAFRIPVAWLPDEYQERDQSLTPGGREGRRLSPYRVNMDHQKMVLLAQLNLAGEMQRPVSVHGVQAHGVVYETLLQTWKGHELEVISRKEQRRHPEKLHPDDEKSNEQKSSGPKPFPPRICLHSYSGPPGPVKQYTHPSVPAKIFFSFSMAVNFSTAAAAKTVEVIRVVPDDKILVESDLHTAGQDMDTYLESIVRKICEIKGWSLVDGVQRLGINWRNFVFEADNAAE